MIEMMSWKSIIKEMSVYNYLLAMFILSMMVYVILRLVYQVEIVSSDMITVVFISLVLVVLAKDLILSKYKLKKKRK